ncbi:MAG: hypothetical protein HYY25_06550 [Candidatus Wallbacteria bacterium]|nr:hypothetical protein [Candidatus Wallbacteria bacterium]
MKQVRGGFVVVELVVVLAVAGVLSGAAWLFFAAGSRQSEQLDRQAASLQSRVTLVERLGTDAAEAFRLSLGTDAAGTGTLQLFKLIPADPLPASGSEATAKPSEPCALQVRTVVYAFDTTACTLLRDGQALTLPCLSGLSFAAGPDGKVRVTAFHRPMPGQSPPPTFTLTLRPGAAAPSGALAAWQPAMDEKP